MNKSISKIIIGALAASLPATVLAAEPEVSLTAKASAASIVAPAETGLRPDIVTPEDADAAAGRYRELARHYRPLGGVAFKAGLVQWAEAQQRKYEPVNVGGALATQEPNHSCHSTKPVVCAQLGVR